ncbi:Uma2 family endonuclease [Streptomyces sp. BR1]|uniref:Uma2 family endonuclease n=1 Tax=Streptomyces sp. BR1 TaxID=1592323 RepID=UPI00402B3FAB
MTALPPLRPRPGHLREVAEKIEEATGLHVQIVGGSIVMSPPRPGKHVGAVYRLRQQIDQALPERLGSYEVSSIPMPGDADDYVTPDLVVLPVEWDEDEDWLADPGDVELAVEVISKSEKARGITQKSDWYAVARVKVLLVVDPRHGTWALHTRPENGCYRDTLPGKYGEDIPLPPPLPLVLTTDRLPLYGESTRR